MVERAKCEAITGLPIYEYFLQHEDVRKFTDNLRMFSEQLGLTRPEWLELKSYFFSRGAIHKRFPKLLEEADKSISKGEISRIYESMESLLDNLQKIALDIFFRPDNFKQAAEEIEKRMKFLRKTRYPSKRLMALENKYGKSSDYFNETFSKRKDRPFSTGHMKGKLGWKLTSLWYDRMDSGILSNIDTILIGNLGSQMINANVVDCGCGTGHMSSLFIHHRAKMVFAVDMLENMLSQVPNDPRIIKILADLREGIPEKILKMRGQLNIVLFKRSMYFEPDVSERILAAFYGLLADNGRIIIIHPEKSFFRYVRGSDKPAKRIIGRLGIRFLKTIRAYEYRTYTNKELMELCRRAAPEGRIEVIPTLQESFNVICLTRP
ncbi:MAG: class I SAM-dependent methyltransferase [Nanoarchaeota archaeon]|nr:class I SAM-dependent methyltransferase [Nanoarchaeota archaeon]